MKKIALIVAVLFFPASAFALSMTLTRVGTTSLGFNITPYRVTLANGNAYVALGGITKALKIYNAANPEAALPLRGSVSLSNVPNNQAVIGSSYDYVVMSGIGNNVIIDNISNPASPTQAGSIQIGFGYAITGVAGYSNYLYATANNNSTLYAYNVTNKLAPTQTAALALANGTLYPTDLLNYNNYLYVLTIQPAQVMAYSLSNPAVPAYTGAATLGSGSGTQYDMDVSNGYLYVTDQNSSKFYVVDITSDPAHPHVVGSASTDSGPFAVGVAGNYAWVGNQSAKTINVFDISTPSNPTLVASTSIANTTISNPYGMAATGNYGFLLGLGDTNMYVYKLAAGSPTCTVTFDQNPISYGAQTTLRWSMSNATSLTINSSGTFNNPPASGSFTVGPLATTDYGGTVTDGSNNGACPATLTVTAPSNPAVSISASSTSISIGQSTYITADYAAGSGDTLTADNIDSPVGTGLGATTDPDASKTIQFTPSSPGTYTFYARATTQYYTPWTTYAQITVTVSAAPSCTISFSQNPIAKGQSSTVSWTSSNASSFSINNIGAQTPNASGNIDVSPLVSTDYTGTASSDGVDVQCTEPGSSPAGTLTVACTPMYTCAGNMIQYTDASCNVSNVQDCSLSGGSCVDGSSACLYPPPSFSQHLQAKPSILTGNSATKLYWSVSDVSSCTVSGSDGESYSGTSSPPGGQTTQVVKGLITYSLSCASLDGSPVNESIKVNVSPKFITY